MAPKRSYNTRCMPIVKTKPPVMTGGYSHSKWVMKTWIHEEQVFVEVVAYPDWLLAMVLGGTRKCRSISGSRLWEHWVARTADDERTNGDEQRGDVSNDPFASALQMPGKPAPCKRAKRKLRASGPRTVQVPWPEGHCGFPQTFLINKASGTHTLLVEESGLCEMVQALLQEQEPTETEPWLQEDSTPHYDQPSRTWRARWWNPEGTSLMETSVVVDNRRRTTRGHEPLSPDTFLQRKVSARSRLKCQARVLGCTTMSGSDREDLLEAAQPELVPIGDASGALGGA